MIELEKKQFEADIEIANLNKNYLDEAFEVLYSLNKSPIRGYPAECLMLTALSFFGVQELHNNPVIRCQFTEHGQTIIHGMPMYPVVEWPSWLDVQ